MQFETVNSLCPKETTDVNGVVRLPREVSGGIGITVLMKGYKGQSMRMPEKWPVRVVLYPGSDVFEQFLSTRPASQRVSP